LFFAAVCLSIPMPWKLVGRNVKKKYVCTEKVGGEKARNSES